MMENQIEIKVSPQKQNEPTNPITPFMASQAFATESIGALKDAQEHEPRLVESAVGLEYPPAKNFFQEDSKLALAQSK
jgi:hypothetical protein